MSFRRKIQFFLVHTLNISNKEAEQLISSGKISVNKTGIDKNIEISDEDEIMLEDKIIRSVPVYTTYLFYKPRGIESTLNENIQENLRSFIPEGLALFPVGRLDKESEGLMILTNDSRIYKEIIEGKLEKEYLVEAEPKPDIALKQKMENGILLDGKLTEPCLVELKSGNQFSIILREGKYRQIRRMCHKCGFKVNSLKRIRIHHYTLENLNPGELKKI